MAENITCMNLEDSVYLDIYKIEGTINADQNPCFSDPNTYPNFQEKLDEFKNLRGQKFSEAFGNMVMHPLRASEMFEIPPFSYRSPPSK